MTNAIKNAQGRAVTALKAQNIFVMKVMVTGKKDISHFIIKNPQMSRYYTRFGDFVQVIILSGAG